jgi:pimeloyl-ACP methyl ester carboxylesterase
MLGDMIDVEFQTIANGDISIEVATKGEGPLIVFVHGWPELWYSWRHQVEHVASRGYQAAAMNVRGYGNSSNPTEIERYTLREITSDVAAVIDALGDGTAVVVGHDWGAPIAWNTARLHPDKVRAVMGMSVPYVPVGPTSLIELFKQIYAGKFFYQLYFQEPGVAEAELGADHARSLRMIYHDASGEGAGAFIAEKSVDAKMLDGMIDPDPLPSFVTADDIATYAAAYETSGWHGPLNRYRAQGLDAADLGQIDAGDLTQPAAFVGGEFDVVRQFMPGLDLFDMAPNHCQDFRGSTIVPGAGHWVQQEAPDATNAALDEFLDSL